MASSYTDYPDYFDQRQIFATIWVAHAALLPLPALVSRLPRYERLQRPRPSIFETTLGPVLAACWLANLVYKWHAQQLAYMLYPCHVLTLAYLFCIFTTDHGAAQAVFNVALFFNFNPVLALIYDDLRDVNLPGQYFVYWLHHIALSLAPYLLMLGRRVTVDRSHRLWFFVALCIGTWFAFGLQLAVANVTSLNLGTMLWPPPGMEHGHLISGPWYHLKILGVFSACGWLFGYPVVWAVNLISGAAAVGNFKTL